MMNDPAAYALYQRVKGDLEAKQKEWDSYRSLITPWEIENYLVK